MEKHGVVTEENGNLTKKKDKQKVCQKTSVSCEVGVEHAVMELWEVPDDVTEKEREEIKGLVLGQNGSIRIGFNGTQHVNVK